MRQMGLVASHYTLIVASSIGSYLLIFRNAWSSPLVNTPLRERIVLIAAEVCSCRDRVTGSEVERQQTVARQIRKECDAHCRMW